MNLPAATENIIKAMSLLEGLPSEEVDEAYDILVQAARSLCEALGLDFSYIAQFVRRERT